MRAKPRKFKKIYQIIALLIAICSLLGVSYAYWEDATTVLGKIDTGTIKKENIDIKKENIRPYQFCATNHGVYHTCDIKNPNIQIKNNGTIPIKIDSIKIEDFTYQTASFTEKTYVSKWRWRGGLFPRYIPDEITPYIFKSNLRRYDLSNACINDFWGNQSCVNSNIILKNFYGDKEIKPNEFGTITLNMDYKKMVDLINFQALLSGNLETVHEGIDTIDVDREGILKVRIDYSQWNTSRGWKDSIQVNIPVTWSRYDYLDSHKKVEDRFKIYPSISDPYALDTQHPDIPKPACRMASDSEESYFEVGRSSSSTTSAVNEVVETPVISEGTESKVEAALEAMEDANKQNESTASKEVVSDGSETTSSNIESSSSISETTTSTTETSSSISESTNISTETSNHTSEAAQSPSVGSTSESSEKAESSSGTSEATSANESN